MIKASGKTNETSTAADETTAAVNGAKVVGLYSAAKAALAAAKMAQLELIRSCAHPEVVRAPSGHVRSCVDCGCYEFIICKWDDWKILSARRGRWIHSADGPRKADSSGLPSLQVCRHEDGIKVSLESKSPKGLAEGTYCNCAKPLTSMS